MPTGTASSIVAPSAPCLRAPRPGSPRPALNLVFARKDGQVAQARVRDEDDVAALAAVAAVGTTLGHVFLAPEAQASVAAAARRHLDGGAIVEQGLLALVGVGLGDRDEALLARRAELDGALALGEDRVVAADAGADAGRNRVPRWRTRIMPAFTFCPAKILTPRRFAFESRPFREDPRPFL